MVLVVTVAQGAVALEEVLAQVQLVLEHLVKVTMVVLVLEEVLAHGELEVVEALEQ
jgi:hypothetical protein